MLVSEWHVADLHAQPGFERIVVSLVSRWIHDSDSRLGSAISSVRVYIRIIGIIQRRFGDNYKTVEKHLDGTSKSAAQIVALTPFKRIL